MLTLFLAAAVTALPPLPPGLKPPSPKPLAPKYAEHLQSLGTPMLKTVSQVAAFNASPGTNFLTSIVQSGNQVIVSWTNGPSPFQVWSSQSLPGPWGKVGSPTMLTSKTCPMGDMGFIRVQGNVPLLSITHTNPTTLTWVAPEIDMSDSLTAFRVLDAPSVPANDTPSSEVGWTLKTTIQPGQPLTYDDTSPLPRSYKIIETTANGVVVPYDVKSASNTAGGSILWAESIDFGSQEFINGITLDPSGNVWFVGQINSTQNPYLLLGRSNADGSQGGSAFINYYQPSSPGSASGRAVVADSSGNIYVTGYFSSALDLGNGHVLTAVSPSGGLDIFLAKFSSSGVCQAARNIGGTGTANLLRPQGGFSLALDHSGSLVVIGSFVGTVDFGNGFTLASHDTSSLAAFILKVNANTLTTSWAIALGSERQGTGLGAVVDASDGIYVCGTIFANPSSDFKGVSGPSHPVTSQNGGVDAFIAKYNSSGVLQWVNNFGGRNVNGANAVALDKLGSIFVCGYYQFTMDAGGGSITSVDNSGTVCDGFVLKLSTSTGAYSWGYYPNNSTLPSFAANDILPAINAVAVDANNNVVITGASYRNTSFTRTPSSAGSDAAKVDGTAGHVFTVKYANNGDFKWGYADGAPNTEEGNCITTDSPVALPVGNIFVGGGIWSSASGPFRMHNSAPRFDTGTSIGVGNTLPGDFNRDGLLMKLGP